MQEEKPLTTIIIPTYNRSGFITKAVESCINQTYDNIEIIIIDDGSTDDTKEVINDMDYGIIEYIWQANAGVSAARNTGIKNSSGDFVLFLDSDDRICPKFVEKSIAELQLRGEQCGATYTSAIVYNDGEFKKEINALEYKLTQNDLLTDNPIGGISCKIVIKDVFDDIGLFDEDMNHSEDFDFFLRMLEKYYITGIDCYLCEFHNHTGEQLTSNIDNKITGQDKLYEKHKQILGQTGRAKQYYSRGITYANDNCINKAKENFYKSVMMDRSNFKYLIHYVAAYFGPTVYWNFIKLKNSVREKYYDYL